jgi:pyruvate formate lyase activating enzyme
MFVCVPNRYPYKGRGLDDCDGYHEGDRKRLDFLSKIRGGVTVSGGELLFQGAFVSMLLRRCKKLGLHTALDTSGYAAWNTFEEVLKNVDLVLYDLKQMDPELHKKATGKNNDLILGNLRKIPPDKRIWLRIPLIPGFNDAEVNIKKVGEIGREMGG